VDWAKGKKAKHIRGTVGSVGGVLESDHRMFISRMTGTTPIPQLGLTSPL
jgi:hypothetical protein